MFFDRLGKSVSNRTEAKLQGSYFYRNCPWFDWRQINEHLIAIRKSSLKEASENERIIQSRGKYASWKSGMIGMFWCRYVKKWGCRAKCRNGFLVRGTVWLAFIGMRYSFGSRQSLTFIQPTLKIMSKLIN